MEKCCSERVHSSISVGEKGSSRIKFSNPNREAWTVCEVDGCLVKSGEKRCDHLLTDNSDFTVLIELKGRDIEKACKQLDKTFSNSEINKRLVGKRAAIVVSKTVKIPAFDTFSAKMKQYFASNHKARFVVERHNREICPRKCCGC